MENPLYMEVLIGQSSINGPISFAMFDYRRVYCLLCFCEPKQPHSRDDRLTWLTFQPNLDLSYSWDESFGVAHSFQLYIYIYTHTHRRLLYCINDFEIPAHLKSLWNPYEIAMFFPWTPRPNLQAVTQQLGGLWTPSVAMKMPWSWQNLLRFLWISSF